MKNKLIIYCIFFSYYNINVCCAEVLPDAFQLNLEWQENIWRKEQLQSTCESLGLSNQKLPNINKLDHLLVDHKHRVVYCYVPKVACTNWKRLFMVMSGRWKNSDILSIPGSVAHANDSVTRLSDLPEKEVINCLTNYTRFLIVRHPFERLVSAFRNKLEDQRYPSARYFQARVGRYIIKHYRINASKASLDRGDDVTFPEFATYLLNEGKDSKTNNEHWRPIVDMCYPCALMYDIIGKYESLTEDSEMILNMVNASHLSFPSTKTAGTSHKMFLYLQQLSLKTMENLYNLYKLDFKLFGYSLENILGFDIG